MKTLTYGALLALAMIPSVCAAQSSPDLPGDYKPVTGERLANPEPENWLMTKGNYKGWSHSELDQIKPDNVSKLKPVWSAATGMTHGHEAPAIVNGRYMFVATPENQVLAFDSKTGRLLWRHKRELPEGFGALHMTNRGVALWDDKVYVATIDCMLESLDAKTGKLIWESQVCDWQNDSAYITSAPLIVKGKVIVGPSGGETSVRGYISAFDAETGKKEWTVYGIPEPGEPGSDSWPQEGEWKDAWKNGGGTMWMPGNYDADNDIIYWGVGNGAPWPGDQRPGKNLYLDSVLSIQPEEGKILGHFQYLWNDSWDWDAVNAPSLVNFEQDGKTVPGLVTAARNGYLYWLERNDKGDITYDGAVPYVKNNVFKELDPKTGQPSYNMENKPGTGKTATYCPSLWGGKDWFYQSYDPKNKMLYIPFNDNHCMTWTGVVQPIIPGQWSAGVDVDKLELKVEKDAPFIGGIQAWNINDRKRMWRTTYKDTFNFGSVLTTAGGVLFAGGTNDRKFRAYDEKTGDLLWEFPMPSGVISPPSSFEIDGKQYIAVVAGFGVDAQWIQNKMHNQLGWEAEVPEGGSVWVFALPDDK
ncbi:PQQ-dependent dehydrogenase, methanol/ethanol family [Methyloligella sp. 2.7D]|uniref:PQQ-dependent dehydrogenase, methanol/ethanol family n=1 Tax=unclassified Methyloligella TaxID=2625955 RepID=UPI00157D17B2|nr:PQQ-dependent dehydrogenase, methanol/ethanol family [Methyloligella sp. GL2]QKP76902.1 PQQ-dependent dehydrogenase, methanol/ethanol family [Methyloligella sp. GL2]